MTLADAINYGSNTLDLIELIAVCLKMRLTLTKTFRESSDKISGLQTGSPVMLKGAIEPVPVDDLFLTGIHCVEHLPGDLVRFWLYVQEDGQRIIKAKTVFTKMAIWEMREINRLALHIVNG